MTEYQFSSLKLPNVCYEKHNKHFYRLYKAQNDAIDVEAESANAAIEQAGFTPIKIDHVTYYLDGAIDSDLLQKEVQSEAEPQEG